MRISSLVILVSAAALLSCSGDGPTAVREVTEATAFELKVGQKATISAHNVYVELTSLSDVRCPADSQHLCVDAGYSLATVVLGIGDVYTEHQMRRDVDGGVVAVDVGGWWLTFIDLRPAVRNRDQPINRRDLSGLFRLDPVS